MKDISQKLCRVWLHKNFACESYEQNYQVYWV